MLSRITHNWTLKLTALVLAFAVWSHVRGQVNPWETMTFKARLKTTAPRGFILLNGEALPKNVVVTLRGPRLTLRTLKGPAPANPLATSEDAPLLPSSQLRAVLEYSNPRKGAQNVSIKATADIEDIEVVGSKPGELSVALDAAETRELEIEPQIPSSDELELESVNLDATRATVSGPSKILDRIDSVRVRVSRSELKAGVLQLERLPLEAIDSDGEPLLGVPIDPAFVRVKIKAREKQSEKSVRLVAKTSGRPNAGFEVGEIEIEPSRLSIRGPRRALDRIDSLPVEVDIAGVDSDINRRVRVDLPKNVQAVDFSRVRVRIEIVARQQSTPEASPSPTPPLAVPPSSEPIN